MFSYLFMAKSINLVSSLKIKIFAFTRRPIDIKDSPFSFCNIYFKTDDYVLRLKRLYSFGWYTLFYKKQEATLLFISISSELPRTLIAVHCKQS